MSELFTRGACPRLAAPMETGDGLLARLVPAGPMHLRALAGLCTAAQTYGNGTMEISARGNLQIRGLTPDTAPLLADRVVALGIDSSDGTPVLADPLPGDPSALIDANALAIKLRKALAGSRLVLAPKVSVIVDGGGRLHLDGLAAEIAEEVEFAGMGIALHVSGCAKGCAHPFPAPLTVTGTAKGAGLVRNATARATPSHYVNEADVAAAVDALSVRETADA